MEPLSFLGIIKLTKQIILKNLNHFLCIALILALPYAITLLILHPSSTPIQSLVAFLSLLYKLATSQGQLPPPDQPSPSTPPSLPLLFAIIIFSIIFSLFSTPLLTFSACRACLNQSLDFKGSLLGVPRSMANLVLTLLCAVGVVLGLYAVAMVVMAIIVAVLLAMNANPAILMSLVSICVLGVVIGVWYLAVAFSLATTVAILEEKRGWEAMRRSMYLLGGRKWLAFWLPWVFGVWAMVLPIPVSREASVVWRWSAAGMSVGLQALLLLFGMCAQVVLYASCKSRRDEPGLDTLIAASPRFGPQHQLSPKYLDLETASFTTTTTTTTM